MLYDKYRYRLECQAVLHLFMCLQGSPGDRGPAGSPGADGAPGERGDTGLSGAKGEKGLKVRYPNLLFAFFSFCSNAV